MVIIPVGLRGYQFAMGLSLKATGLPTLLPLWAEPAPWAQLLHISEFGAKYMFSGAV